MAKGHKNQHINASPVKLDDREYRIKCVSCRKEFIATRSDASYCSVNCRKYASRAPQRRATALDDIKAMNFRLTEISKAYKLDDEIFQEMQALAKTLRGCISRFEQTDPQTW